MDNSEPYGQECIIDVHDLAGPPLSREQIACFCKRLCDIIDMEREDLFFWAYEGDPEGYSEAPAHLKGISAVQFIKTSNITIHSLDELKRMYLNIFSCKPFDASVLREFVEVWTGGRIVNFQVITRM